MMITTLMALGLPLATAATAAAPDTLIPVEPGTRVAVHAHDGTIVVRSWDRDVVEAEVAEGEGRIRIFRSGGTLTLRAAGRHGQPTDAHLTVRVPTRSPVEIHATSADVRVEGAGGPVAVHTVDGDVRLSGGTGLVRLHTVSGDVEVADAAGRLEVHTMNGDVRLAGVEGDVAVNAVDGDVFLERLRSSRAEATTVDGDVVFTGDLLPSGYYRFSTHDGDVTVGVPEGAGAYVSVASWAGEFESSFPVTWEDVGRARRREFTIGDGGARLELQSFDGTIRLVRPADAAPPGR